jgi:hypothetical protein
VRKQLYVHIGYGKTGTSAIQLGLYKERARLLDRGILYPLTGLSEYGHYLLAPLDETPMSANTSGFYESLLNEVNSSSAQKIVLSAESFCFASGDFVKDLRKLMDSFIVKIIIYVREQVALLSSTYLEWQKQGLDCNQSIEDYFEFHWESFDFMKRIEPWAEHFGSHCISARLYDRNITGEDVVPDFLSILGVKRLPGYATATANTSILPDFSNLLAMLDSLDPPLERRSEFVRELLQLSRQFAGRSSTRLVGSELYSAVRTRFASSNMQFAAQFLTPAEAELLVNEPKRSRYK